MKNDDLMKDVNEMLDKLMQAKADSHEPDEVEIDQALDDLKMVMDRNRAKYVIMAHWGRDEEGDPQGRFGVSGTDKDIREALGYAVFRIGTDKSRPIEERELMVALLSSTLMAVTRRLIKETRGSKWTKMNRDGEPKN